MAKVREEIAAAGQRRNAAWRDPEECEVHAGPADDDPEMLAYLDQALYAAHRGAARRLTNKKPGAGPGSSCRALLCRWPIPDTI
jgi:hypothetical protein